MSDYDGGYRQQYQYRPNTDPPSNANDRQIWSAGRDAERLQSAMKDHSEHMASLSQNRSGAGGNLIVLAALLLFIVGACLVAVAKELMNGPVPAQVAFVGLWFAYVSSGALAGGVLLALVERFSPVERRVSRRRRRLSLFVGMAACGVVTWQIEEKLSGIGAMARALMVSNGPNGILLTAATPQLPALLIEQAPGAALLVLVLALGLGPKYRSFRAVPKSGLIAVFAVGCALAVILTCGILRAS